MSDEFLPNDFEVPNRSNGYLRFKQGSNRIRILSKAIYGYEGWLTEYVDGKEKSVPVRRKEIEDIPDEAKNIKHFWAFVVWNVGEKRLQILSITQTGIQDNIMILIHDPDWGNATPFTYDLDVIREGEGLDTKYAVNPKPKAPVDPAVLTAYKEAKINLDALWTNADPFEEVNSESLPKNKITEKSKQEDPDPDWMKGDGQPADVDQAVETFTKKE